MLVVHPRKASVHDARACVVIAQVSTESAAEGEGEAKSVVEFRPSLEYSQPSQPQKEKKRTGSSSASPDKKVGLEARLMNGDLYESHQ